jgi:fucose permease
LTECLAQIGQAPQEQGTSRRSKFRQIFGLKAVHLLAFFNLVYVGVEVRNLSKSMQQLPKDELYKVTIGGWIVTYIINVRGGGPSSGYVSAGFFGGTSFHNNIAPRFAKCRHVGLMIGRVALLWFNKMVTVALYRQVKLIANHD